MHCDYIHDLGYDLCVKPWCIGGYSHGLPLKIKTWKYAILSFFFKKLTHICIGQLICCWFYQIDSDGHVRVTPM